MKLMLWLVVFALIGQPWLAAGEAPTMPPSLAPRALIESLALAQADYLAKPTADGPSTQAIMACVGLCLAGTPEEQAGSGPWRQIAKTIAAERSARRGGKPAVGWKEAMPELWVRLLDGALDEVRRGLDAVPQPNRDVMWRVLYAYVTRDPGDLRQSDGPWATMALLWCGRLAPEAVSNPELDPFQVELCGYYRQTPYRRDRAFRGWVSDIAWMLRTKDLPDDEAMMLLRRLATGVGADSKAATRGALIQSIDRACRQGELVNAAVIGTCLDALERCLGGARGGRGEPRILAGLGDVAQWLADRTYDSVGGGLMLAGHLRGKAPTPLAIDLLRTHDQWPIIARLRFGYDRQPRLPGARAGMIAAIERCLKEPARCSPHRLFGLMDLIAGEARLPEIVATIDAAVDPDHPAAIAQAMEALAKVDQNAALAARLRRAYAAGNRDLITVWHLGVLEPGPLFVVPDRVPERAWVDATVDNTTLPWPNLGRSSEFAIVWNGWVKIETAGEHRFAIVSDDGSRLHLGDRLCIDNGGNHAMERKAAAIILPAGWQPLTIEYFQGGGGAGCRFEWCPPGGKGLTPIPAANLAHGDDHAPGLAARGYAMPESELRESLPALLVAAAAAQPHRLDLQDQVCYRAIANGLIQTGVDAARRIAALAIAGRFGGEGFEMRVASQGCDSAVSILLASPVAPDRRELLALLRNMQSVEYLPPGCQIHPGNQLEEGDSFDTRMRDGLRLRLMEGLLTHGFCADSETLKSLQARRERASERDAHLEGLCALCIGDLRLAHRLYAGLITGRRPSRFGNDHSAESILEWALFERMFAGREPDIAAVDAALKQYGPPPAYALAWKWISGRASWAEVIAQKDATVDGDVLFYLRGIYLISLGRSAEAKQVLDEFSARNPKWTESHKAKALIAALPGIAEQALPKAAPLPKDDAPAPATATGSDF